MNKKLKMCLIIFLLILLIFVVLPVLLNLIDANKPIYGLSDGTYAVTIEDSLLKMRFNLHENEQSIYGSFIFCEDETEVDKGYIDIKRGYVIAISQRKDIQYKFKITDNNTITFCEKKSDPLYMLDGITVVDDKTNFVYIDGSEHKAWWLE